MTPTICFDFDGVIHSYTSGWQGEDVISDPPVRGIELVLKHFVNKGYNVVVCSSRSTTHAGSFAIAKYMEKYKLPYSYITSIKPAALVYVDDRAIHFKGDCSHLIEQIENFKPWYQEDEHED